MIVAQVCVRQTYEGETLIFSHMGVFKMTLSVYSELVLGQMLPIENICWVFFFSSIAGGVRLGDNDEHSLLSIMRGLL